MGDPCSAGVVYPADRPIGHEPHSIRRSDGPDPAQPRGLGRHPHRRHGRHHRRLDDERGKLPLYRDHDVDREFRGEIGDVRRVALERGLYPVHLCGSVGLGGSVFNATDRMIPADYSE